MPGAAAQPAALRCDGRAATIVGTSERDFIEGTPGDDVIVALGGDDRIDARGGDDVICALAGSDRIWGGPGRDRIFGGADAWWSDRAGAIRVGDSVWPGPGRDYVDLGADLRRADLLYHDRLDYRAVAQGIVANLSPGVGTVLAEGVDTVRVHRRLGVIGTRFADMIIDGPKGDLLVGGRGDDTIIGRGGDDIIVPEGLRGEAHEVDADRVDGGAGNDRISSRLGPDDIAGGLGHDTITVSQNPRVAVHAGPGNDTVHFIFGGRPRALVDGGLGRDHLELSVTAGDGPRRATLDLRTGTLSARGWPGTGTVTSTEEFGLQEDFGWRVFGTDVGERVSGGWEHPLRAWMGGGDDEIYGTSRDDYIDAGDGEDTVWALAGTDTCLNAEHVRYCEIKSVQPEVMPSP